jgi:tetratricopeptide (TPR) repeat protein
LTRLIPIAALAVGLAHAQSAQQGQLDASSGLFTVMAAVNAAGGSGEVQPVVAEHLRGKKLAVLPELQVFLKQHMKGEAGANLAPYVSFALASGDPPEFAPRLEGAEVPPDVQLLTGFRELVMRFHREADIDGLWQKSQPAVEAALARYHEPVSRAILESNAYLRNPTSGYMGRRFQIYLDLLGPANQVHTRSYKDDYFVVVTPSSEPRIDDIRHAYLHYLLDPLATKYSERLMRARGLGDFAQAAPVLDVAYKDDFLLLATESLIKAVEARLNRKPSLVQEALTEGFLLTPYFADALPVYEKQEVAMRLYLPDMLDAIDLKKEDRRLKAVQFATSKAVRTVPAPKPVEPQVNPVDRALEPADKLYGSRELPQAREAYLKLIRETDNKAIHARAYFGLARVAALNKEPELAEQLFRKTLELSPDPYTGSWAEVYLGRLAEGFGERDQAAQRYKAALAVEGAPPGARQAAEQGLQKLAPR